MRRGNRIGKAVLPALLFCSLLCGCGRQESAVLIGRSGEAAESGRNAGAYAPEDGQAAGTYAPGDGAAGGLHDAENGRDGALPETETPVYVYVCGAVNSPGVVALEPGSRVEDALEAAGGFADAADRSCVNLAARVTDGEQIYFPTEEEALAPEGQRRTADTGLVNINTADAAQLCTLPGIGASRAEDIIAYREENGGFQTEEDIMKVSGIKTAAYDKLRDKITVK